MNHSPDVVEEVSPQAAIQAELSKLQSQKGDFWIIVAFAEMVLFLGILSFFFPHGFWHVSKLSVSLSPQLFYVIMVAVVLAYLFYTRRDTETKALRLAILQQALASQKEQAASMIDAVTNVFTRGFLQNLLKAEISRAERTNRALGLLMCDLNNFKQVNDRFGHLMGDYVLSEMATILKACLRGSDSVIRYGGDEFLAVLPETDEKGAEVVRQRIILKVGEWDKKNRVGDLPISLSLGLYLHIPGQTLEKDLAEADARMYADKQATKHGSTLTSPSTIQ